MLSVWIARVWKLPTAIALARLVVREPRAWIGVRRWLVVPSPSWPVELLPQAKTVPSARMATLWLSPAASRATEVSDWIPLNPLTWLGALALKVLLLPSWPEPLFPQAQTVPLALSAR